MGLHDQEREVAAYVNGLADGEAALRQVVVHHPDGLQDLRAAGTVLPFLWIVQDCLSCHGSGACRARSGVVLRDRALPWCR